ncbi:MAG: molybdenum cofactor guanylyltransferase [Clostridiales bacterium]|nr:molybdenum cofactor guanylyltransferase [Clostridiales bacterium]
MESFVEAFILCGGKSRRMGFDKALMKIGGEYVIEAMAAGLSSVFGGVNLCVGGADSDKFARFGINLIEDIYTGGIGPAAAIHAALSCAKSKYIFTIAVDMPLLNPDHILHMKSLVEKHAPDALIPMNSGFAEPLYAFYSVDVLEIFACEIEKGEYAMRKILTKFDTFYMDECESRKFDANLAMFTNLNYPEELSKYESFCRLRGEQ